MENPASSESTRTPLSAFISALLIIGAARALRVGLKAWLEVAAFELPALLRFWVWYVLAFACIIAAIAGPPRVVLEPAQRGVDVLMSWARRLPGYVRRTLSLCNTYAPIAVVLLIVGRRFIARYGVDYFGTDGLLFSQFAVDSLLEGKNPYSLSMADAFTRYAADPAFGTYRIDGNLVTELSYPALSVLAFLPQRLLGIPNIDLTSLVVLGIVFVWLVAKAPAHLKWFPLAMLWAQWDLVSFSAGGVFDVLWVLPLLGSMALFARGRLVIAGVLFGLACSVKQTPWFVAPFLVLWLGLESANLRTALARLGRSAGAAALAFIVVNLPFMISDMSGWMRGVLVPVAGGAPLVEIGTGPIMANIAGVTHLPKVFFSLLMASACGLVALAYALWFSRLKWLAFTAPMIVLWFNYRSLQNYYIFLLPVAFFGLLLQTEATDGDAPRFRVRRQSIVFAAACVAVIAMLVAAGAWLSPRTTLAARADIRALRDPDALGRVSELDVELTNDGPTAITPTFGVVHSRHQTPVHWNVSQGPTTLAAGASALYTLTAPIPTATVPYRASMHLRIYDLGTERRTAVVLKRVLAGPAPMVVNPTYRRWTVSHLGAREPFLWTARTPAQLPKGAARFEETADGIHISVSGKTQRSEPGRLAAASIEQQLGATPTSLHIDATPDTTVSEGADVDAQPLAGVELLIPDYCIAVVFAAQSAITVRNARLRERACRVIALPAASRSRLVTDVSLRELVDKEHFARFEGRHKPVLRLFAAIAADGREAAASATFHDVRAPSRLSEDARN